MAEKSSFFTSLNGDRKYKATDFAKYFSAFVGNGVFPNPSTNLQVTSNGDMTINLSKGLAWIDGYIYDNTDNLTLTVDHSDAALKRIDRVVLRCDFIGREIKAHVKKGVFSSTPVAPSLQRDVNAYELSVADVLIENGVVAIQQSKITDTRLNTAICGIVTQIINEVDTTTLYNKLQHYIEERGQDVEGWIGEATQRWEHDFVIWFNKIKGALGDDTAGNLTNMIFEDRTRMDQIDKNLSNIVLTSDRINLVDAHGVFSSTTVDEALFELYSTELRIKKQVDQLKQSHLQSLLEKDLEGKSTSMDVGYWVDSLKDTNNMISTTGQVRDNKLQANGMSSSSASTLFKPYDVGFLYSKITFYLKRNSGNIVPVDRVTGREVIVNPYKITMRLEQEV